MRSRIPAGLTGIAMLLALIAGQGIPAAATHGADTEVTVGSRDDVFSQNKQNEPAVAIDANHPNVVAAGANDNIDVESCDAGVSNDCPFTDGVGLSGIAFSFDSGDTWMQPEYTGFSARNCLGDPDPAVTDDVCEPDPDGPIGTLPGYFESGLQSDGDPAVAFGPVPDENGSFAWDNGSRLYYASLAGNFPGTRTFKGFEAIAVSRIDGPAGTGLTEGIVGDQTNWRDPVIVTKQSSADFADKEQIWADNAASSPFFGNVYVCFAEFRGAGAAPLVVSHSTDGGDTWETDQVTPAHNVAPRLWGQSGCTIRTDSQGVVSILFTLFQDPSVFLPPHPAHMIVQSFDGGETWTKQRQIRRITDPCFLLQFDGTGDRCVMDGIGGARNDLSSSPSVDIANGAPTGENATDVIYSTWVDATDGGLNDEHVLVSFSTDGGRTWSDPEAVETDPADRGFYSAVALSPSGDDAYLVYNAFTTPLRENTTDPRSLVGVVLHADVDRGTGAFTGFAEVHRGEPGDPRGSAQNNLVLEFLGDYVYADATDEYGVAVWNDVRMAADCPAVDAWRAETQELGVVDTTTRPAPQQDCAPVGGTFFGNSDIFGWSGVDPTP